MAHENFNPDIYTIHEAFAATDYGQQLASRIRYEKYNLASLSNEEWVKLLGADVNNLTHMPLTYGLARSFILETESATPGTLDSDEQMLLKVAALIHDQGEAIVGDISFGDKTEESEAEEKLELERNLDAFCPGVASEMKKMIVQARDEVVFDTPTKLSRMFNAIERVGYVRTALRAADHVQSKTAGTAERGLRWIVADVLSNQTQKLINYAADYPAIQKYLTNQSDKISAAYGIVGPDDFKNYGDSQQMKEAQFHEAQNAWSTWLRESV